MRRSRIALFLLALQVVASPSSAQGGCPSAQVDDVLSSEASPCSMKRRHASSRSAAHQIAMGLSCPWNGTRKVYTVMLSMPASSGSSRLQYEQAGSLKTATRRWPLPRTVLIASASGSASKDTGAAIAAACGSFTR